MIILGLAILLLFIYLIYCIIDTHNVALENYAMLRKLLEIKEKKQSDTMASPPLLSISEAEKPSE